MTLPKGRREFKEGRMQGWRQNKVAEMSKALAAHGAPEDAFLAAPRGLARSTTRKLADAVFNKHAIRDKYGERFLDGQDWLEEVLTDCFELSEVNMQKAREYSMAFEFRNPNFEKFCSFLGYL